VVDLDETAAAASLLPNLLGGWTWVCSSGGFAGHTVCASTTGVVQTMEFREDSVFRLVRSDTLLIEASFRVVRQNVGSAGDSINALHVGALSTPWALEMPSADRLLVLEQCMDCYVSTWARSW